MRLAVDASTLVAELLRERGRRLVAHPDLELAVAAEAWSEAQHELHKRLTLMVERGHLDALLAARVLEGALRTVAARVTLSPPELYADRLAEARQRVPRDLLDAPTVALALAQERGIWTADRDFFGCGVPVWTTGVLEAVLAR